jgi:hypothetical protein
VPGFPPQTITINNITIIDSLATRYKLVCPVKEKWCADNDRDGACDDRLTAIEVCRGDDPNDSGTNTNYISDNGTIDNCPKVPNPFEIANHPYSELILKGAVLMGNGFWFDDPDDHIEKTFYKWQPDHDMDGIGDACDLKTTTGNDGYSISMAWKSKNSLVSFLGKNSEGKVFELNKFVGISVSGGYFSPVDRICLNGRCIVNEGTHRVHYCGLDLYEYCEQGIDPEKTGCNPGGNMWDSLCQTEEVDGKKFGRSHATVTNVTANGRERWPHIAWDDTRSNADKINHTNVSQYKNPIPVSHNMSKTTPSAYWNWRADIFAQYNCVTTFADYAICEDSTGKIRENTPIYYNLSSNFAGNSNQYITVGGDINPDYFKNNFTGGSFADIGKWGMATRLNTGKAEIKYMEGVSLLTPDELKDSYKRFISQLVISGSTQNIMVPPGTLIFNEVSFVKFRNGGYVKTGETDYDLVSSEISFVPRMKQLIDGDRPGVTYAIAESGDGIYDLSVNYAPSSDWHILGTVFNYGSYDLEWSSATIHNKTIYLSSKDAAAPTAPVYRIVRSDNGYEIQFILRIPLEGASDIRLISAMENLYFFEDSNGVLKTWSVDLDTETYTEVTSGMIPAYIRPFNIIGTETGIYIAGKYDPANPDNTIIAKLSDNNGWQIIQSGVNAETGKLIMNVIDGKLVMTDIFSDDPVTTRMVLDTADDSVIIEEIETPDIYGIEEVSGSYCLNETDSIVKGGLEISGECVPFTHPWYRSFATGSTIYSVAGKGDRLYVGTNNSIKVYDISDPEAFVLKSTFSTGGRIVYDLEVADDDVMYAATSGGIYKLDTANPDTLASLSFFATSYNYQYRIQLYNDKLYVGDDNGINIRDKETFTRLAYVNIDSVLDFAIANGEIALYRSSFWSAGLHIRDVETLNLKAYEYAECYTGELTTDHGGFYLSCDGYEYRFEGRPDTYFNFYPLDGDIREMQENHVYNGWTYIPDGSNVKLSTLNDVPSYCGNGVIEEGELCDGNSVACTTLDPDYTGGSAACNSTCNGYNESNCEEDGW